MPSSSIKPRIINILVLLAILTACTSPPNYAPVIAYFPEPNQDQSQYYLVQPGETLEIISTKFSLDIRMLAHWNNLTPPYKVNAGQQIRLFNPNPSVSGNNPPISGKIKPAPPKPVFVPHEKPPVIAYKPILKKPVEEIANEKTTVATEKKSTISIDKEKVLKLNFQWPIKGKVLKPFSQLHNKGIDISGKTGQSVMAAEAGKVVYSGQGLLGYGNLLIIKHNELYLSAYGNNSRLLVAEGDAVNKGQAVAEIGQMGSKRPALHFEIRKNGKPLNPLNFLSKK